MEGNNYSLNPHDELRRLQDKVRKLELQNEQLRSQQLLRNGLFENKQSIISSLCADDAYSKQIDRSNTNDWDDHILKAEEMSNEEFENEETWLCNSSHNNSPTDILIWYRQDLDNHSNYEVQRLRRMLVQKVDSYEQICSRQNSIDTRTFTRPKKRINHSSSESMSPISENRNVPETRWKHLLSQQIPEAIDDFNFKYDNTLPSFTSPSYNTFNKNDNSYNATYLKLMSDPQLNASDSLLNSTFVVPDTNTFSHKSDSDLSNDSRKGSDISLNATYLKVDLARADQNMTRTITSTSLNSTFCVNDKSNHRAHPASCDSGGDDDQLSSASDSSFSSSTRLMNAGDVQTIARLQEESLKEMTSTPKQIKSKEGLMLCEDSPVSPIKRSTTDLHHDYLSDHSDHSSAEGKIRSSRSSVRSSPAGSPFGSTIALVNECPQPASTLVPRQEIKVSHQVPPIQEVRKSETVARPAGYGRTRPISGLRPPSVRSGTSALNRPSSVGGSNIPRPASRIPAPRIRATYTTQQPSSKVNWMDGCY